MLPFIQPFFNFFATFSLFVHPHIAMHHHFPFPPITPTPTPKEHLLKATATINEFGKTATLSAEFPKEGGIVKGTISGDCTGKIQGVYTGEKFDKQIRGMASAKCPLLFFDVNGVGMFSGSLNDNDTNANVNYTIRVQDNTLTGSTSFTIIQE